MAGVLLGEPKKAKGEPYLGTSDNLLGLLRSRPDPVHKL
jgi:hypothetical protein